jgi:hypothetical protein
LLDFEKLFDIIEWDFLILKPKQARLIFQLGKMGLFHVLAFHIRDKNQQGNRGVFKPP